MLCTMILKKCVILAEREFDRRVEVEEHIRPFFSLGTEAPPLLKAFERSASMTILWQFGEYYIFLHLASQFYKFLSQQRRSIDNLACL